MSYWVARLNAEDAAALWHKAEPLLAPAIRASGGLFEPADVRELVTKPLSGTIDGWSLWLIGDDRHIVGAWTTDPQRYPRDTILRVMFAGGRGMTDWYDTALGETDKFARENGIKRIRCGGREGWARLGYRKIGTLHERLVTS